MNQYNPPKYNPKYKMEFLMTTTKDGLARYTTVRFVKYIFLGFESIVHRNWRDYLGKQKHGR